jgi:cytochrome c-type biogenesis protein
MIKDLPRPNSTASNPKGSRGSLARSCIRRRGLATVNPCGFSLLPALLSFYIGAEDDRAQRSAVWDALRVGGAVAIGVLGVFLLVGVPIILGASGIVRAVPQAGVITGTTLAIAGALTLSGRHLSLPLRKGVAAGSNNRGSRMLASGIAYGIASLGCTLPIFLSVIGASLATRGSAAALLVLGSYALGMLSVVMPLSLAAAFARQGLASRMKTLLPRTNRIGGILLTVAGIYLTYYWGRVAVGPGRHACIRSDRGTSSANRSGSRTLRCRTRRVARRIRRLHRHRGGRGRSRSAESVRAWSGRPIILSDTTEEESLDHARLPSSQGLHDLARFSSAA